MDTAVFHNLAPDTNRIAHATRGHLVALGGGTCLYVWKFQYSKQCKKSCYMYVNSTYYHPIATKLRNFIERNNLYHLGNRMIC